MDVLADCRASVTRDRVYRNGQSWIRMYCQNCGANCGYIPERNDCFSWSLCDSCEEKHGAAAALAADPDALWFERVRHEQIELYGRELSLYELVTQLDNPDSKLSKLARDKPRFGNGE